MRDTNVYSCVLTTYSVIFYGFKSGWLNYLGYSVFDKVRHITNIKYFNTKRNSRQHGLTRDVFQLIILMPQTTAFNIWWKNHCVRQRKRLQRALQVSSMRYVMHFDIIGTNKDNWSFLARVWSDATVMLLTAPRSYNST
jgi:hypothetical protein